VPEEGTVVLVFADPTEVVVTSVEEVVDGSAATVDDTATEVDTRAAMSAAATGTAGVSPTALPAWETAA